MVAAIKHWSISSKEITQEAEKMGLSVQIIHKDKNFYQISDGNKSVLFKSSDFGGNSAVALRICNDKILSQSFLEMHNFPVAKTHALKKDDFEDFNSNIIKDFRFPLIIKPHNDAHGNGVCMHIMSFDELATKLKQSFEQYSTMLIQEEIQGDEIRVLCLFGKVFLAYMRIPPFVIGNGKNSIQELVEEENQSNPNRGNGYEKDMAYIPLDEECKDYIAKQNYTFESILPEGKKVQLRGNSNMGTGGVPKNVTNELSPETKKILESVVKELKMNLCGIDVITPDLTKPLTENGIILELGATPGIGGDRTICGANSAKAILEGLFGTK